MPEVEAVEKAHATGEDLQRVVEAIQKTVDGEDVDTIYMACLAFALILQYPEISTEQIQAGVYGSSQWIALFVSSLENDGKMPKNQVN